MLEEFRSKMKLNELSRKDESIQFPTQFIQLHFTSKFLAIATFLFSFLLCALVLFLVLLCAYIKGLFHVNRERD